MPKAVALREQGNQLYKACSSEGVAPVLFVSRSRQCLSLYTQGLAASKTNDERASCHKNIGALHKLQAARSSQTQAYLTKLHPLQCLLAAIQSYLLATRCWASKTTAWRNQLQETLDETLQAYWDVSIEQRELELPRARRLLQAVIDGHAESPAKCKVLRHIGKHLLHRCIVVLQSSSNSLTACALALSFINEAQIPANAAALAIQEAASPTGPAMAPASKIFDHLFGRKDTEELLEDISKHLSICESTKARLQGDHQRTQALEADEALDMSAVYQAVDLYKFAVVITREMDVECEAQALSRLGMLYHQVVKDEGKAVAYLKRGLELAQSLYPVPVQADWFKDIRGTLALLQQATARRCESEWQQKRKPLLKKLENQLDGISSAFKDGSARLIQHLYKHHPPHNKDHKQPDCSPDNLKQALRTSILHFHPDKRAGEADEQFVLCEEIVKLLTQKYEILK